MSFLEIPEIFSIGIAVGIMALAQFAVFYIYKERKDRKYNEESNRAQIEMLRESFEKRIYELTDRLMSKDERWRDLNHLILESKGAHREFYASDARIQKNSFLEASGLKPGDFEIEEDLVFVLTPFNSKFDTDYRAIADVCGEVGLRCVRGDEEYIRGDILAHILKHIAKARVVVANINGRNPNVFYELGIAHALGKPALILSQTVDDIPFDLRTRQLVIYKTKSDLQQQLRKALLRMALGNA